MASVLYVASLNPRDGKTVLSAALASVWQQAGKRVEYLKPISIGDSCPADEEFLFSRRALGLEKGPGSTVSIAVTPGSQEGSALEEVQSKVKTICRESSEDADVVILEAPGGAREGDPGREISPAVVQAIDAKVLLVARYVRGMDKEGAVAAAQLFGEALAGVVVNAVPKLSWRLASTSFTTSLTEAGLKVLGLIPESRAMLGISVRELIEKLNGRYALEIGDSEALVESILVGANVLDTAGYPAGPQYFGAKENKAVISKGDRPDFQWAALDTHTLCLILTGNHEPIPYVVEKAREKQIPLAVVEKDTLDILASVEELLADARFDGKVKLERFQALTEESVDLSALNSTLGI
ncbi:MAG: AAA family ATPase [Dehalococcoidia bacterium]